MKLVSIFVAKNSEEGIWSIRSDGEPRNEFVRFFDLMKDVEWLYNFFDEHEDDLYDGFFGNWTIEMAVSRTLEEAKEIENILYAYSERGFEGPGKNLQHLFRPLNNFEYTITTHQKSKARIRGGWLRLYAIRLAENCYLVTGGAIKLTPDMQRSHLQNELKKLEWAKQLLRSHEIYYTEDLNPYKNE